MRTTRLNGFSQHELAALHFECPLNVGQPQTNPLLQLALGRERRLSQLRFQFEKRLHRFDATFGGYAGAIVLDADFGLCALLPPKAELLSGSHDGEHCPTDCGRCG